MARYQNILDAIGNTPLVKFRKLGSQGINLYARLKAFNPRGSVKDRMARGVIMRAELSGEPGITGTNLDLRDKYLSRHMHQRLALASDLPPERQIRWAQKCRDLALCQHRTAFFLMACMWLSTIKNPLT